MANDFAMVYRGIFDGSFHDAPPYAKLVLIAMMMDASADGMVRFFPETWAARIPCTPDEARAALDILKAPDPHDSSGVEDGRRIIDHGGNLYEIVNYPAYRQHRTAIERREYMRQKQAEHRARKAEKAQVPEQPANSVSKTVAKSNGSLPPIPESLMPMRTAIESFIEHRKEIKKPLTPRAMALVYGKLEKWGFARGIQAIEESIAGRYQGLFEPRSVKDITDPPSERRQLRQWTAEELKEKQR
jgi:hypothetical protein